MKKQYIIIGIALAAAGLVVYFLFKNKTTKTLDSVGSTPSTAFDADDLAAYKETRDLLIQADSLAPSWVDPLALANYNANRPEDQIAGKRSKALAFRNTVGAVIANKNGKYDVDGKKWLWSLEQWKAIYNPVESLKVKYGGF